MPNQWLIDSIQRVEALNQGINEAQKTAGRLTTDRDALQRELYGYWKITAGKVFTKIKDLPGVVPTDRSDTSVKFNLADRAWLFVLPQILNDTETYKGFYNLHPTPKPSNGSGCLQWRWDADPDYVIGEVVRQIQTIQAEWEEQLKKEQEEDSRIYE